METNTTMQHQFQVLKIAIMAEELVDYAEKLMADTEMTISHHEKIMKVIALLESAQEIINPAALTE